MSVLIHSYFGARPKAEGLLCKDPSLAQQHFKKECDINEILDKYQRTGVLPDGLDSRPVPSYSDTTGVGDFSKLQQTLVDAQGLFAALPVTLRSRFHNEPSELMAFVANASNHDEAVKLGLITPKPVVVPSDASGVVSAPVAPKS
nr:MAG: internal scaffolding protein [Microviridae sp.]